jgi:D-arabinitol 4-dehydrogenase
MDHTTPTYTMLHLGLGSFHRAHQAVYLHQLRQLGDHRWVLAGGNIRPDMPDTVAALRAQGGAYTLETVTPQGECTYTRITSIQTVVPYDAELSGLVARGAQPDTRIISFTVTEAGYYLDAKDQLDLGFADLKADLQALAQGHAGSTIYGALTTILRARMQRNAGAVTLLNCDNLRHNGDRSRSGLLQFLELLGDPMPWWTASRRGLRRPCAPACWPLPAWTTRPH